MVKQEQITADAPSAFQFKGSLFTLSVLHLKTLDLAMLADELAMTIERSPNFFKHAPIVLDIQSFAKLDVEIPFTELLSQMRAHSLIPVGIRGGSTAQQTAALAAGCAVFPNTKHDDNPHNATSDNAAETATTQPKTKPTPILTGSNTRVVTQPVRSGQQIYAKGGDLLVLGSVSHGAELLADGHIHVYGALRGRALAGIQGDTNAHILCRELDAELISIAGRYQLSEHIKTKGRGQTTHVFLRDEQLHTESF